MLLLGIVTFSIAIPLCYNTVNTFHYTRLAVIIFIISVVEGVSIINICEGDISIYCSLVFQSDRTLFMEVLLFIVGSICLMTFNPEESSEYPKEYSLVVIFSVIGGSIILSSNDLITIYLSTELQSFALYIIAALSRDSLRSVQASVKYFILGAWSSAFILLGVGIIYTSTGSTSLVSMSDWISSTSTGPFSNAGLGLIFIYCGYLFKVSAAPFHNWAPDVYQNTPTVVTMMLITIPKVSIIAALFTLTNKFIDTNVIYALLVVSVASIVIGAVTGLVQTQLRRLMAFSTINHVGFIVLCLSIGAESSSNALIFYVFQYSLSTILIWISIIAYEASERSVNYLSDLRQSFSKYSLVTFSIVISLFSIIGLPPIVGFIAKMNVLWSSVEEGAYVNFMIAIMSSVVSASYYLKIIKIIMFDEGGSKMIEIPQRIRRSNISPLHAYTISTGTAFISLFILDSEFLINSIELAILTI
uniref:NADH-ubiquinone oxidoreductase chain 2 n=1 Tax=Phakopsora meibomiae TaxID=169999 RepID=D8V182_9BASI|nr:NADH dehydrogenase subunit 2 [Phakopsora meibomiae]ACT36167.1 NADH dehydrogenase subunit 2 [Phakopsora meibomiae]